MHIQVNIFLLEYLYMIYSWKNLISLLNLVTSFMLKMTSSQICLTWNLIRNMWMDNANNQQKNLSNKCQTEGYLWACVTSWPQLVARSISEQVKPQILEHEQPNIITVNKRVYRVVAFFYCFQNQKTQKQMCKKWI